MSTTFTLFHDGSFCVGMLEIHEDGLVRAARHVFGATPTDAHLYEWLLTHGIDLVNAADDAVAVPESARQSVGAPRNPKRAAREAARQAKVRGPATTAQESVKASIAERADQHRRQSAESRDEVAEHRREMRIARQRAHHRGR